MPKDISELQGSADRSTVSRFDLGGVVAVSSAHLLHDTYSAFLLPMLPLLIDKFAISLTLAGALTLVVGLPSLLQPLIGYMADRVNLRHFVIIAPALTVTVMSLVGTTPHLGVLMLMLLVVGTSSAFFHAPGAVIITRLAGRKMGVGLSIYTMAGELGRMLGPIMIVAAISLWTLEGTYRMVVIGLVVSAVLCWRLRDVPMMPPKVARPNPGEVIRQIRPLLGPIVIIVTARAFLFAALITYLPTYMAMSGASLWLAGASLAIVEGAGVIGVLVGGSLSDLWGRKKILMIAYLMAPILMLAFVSTPTDNMFVFPLLILMGFTAISTMPVLMAAILELFDENRASANGVLMAVTFSIGSLVTLVVGFLGDQFGLKTAFTICASVALLGVPFIRLIPTRQVARPEPAAAVPARTCFQKN